MRAKLVAFISALVFLSILLMIVGDQPDVSKMNDLSMAVPVTLDKEISSLNKRFISPRRIHSMTPIKRAEGWSPEHTPSMQFRCDSCRGISSKKNAGLVLND